MALLLVFGVMTLVAMAAVLWPLVFRPRTALTAADNDVAVYRDQLAEVERDREAGTIGETEARAARMEVSRRLLAAAQRNSAPPKPPAPVWWRRRGIAIAALVALQIGAGSLYYVLGAPDLPGQPLASRTDDPHGGDGSVVSMFMKVEAHLREHPEDGRGWEVIAPVYMRLGRYDDAVKARANALRLLGPTAQRLADLGEAMVAAANNVVTPEAKRYFDDAIRLDPTDVSARFYQGLAAEQAGNRDEARRMWMALLADAPEEARWVEVVRRALARLDQPPVATSPVAQANAPASDGQEQMIRGMVERLAARLRQDGSNVEGWLQLVRSYRVLGDLERMRAAIADARRALAADAEKLRRFEERVEEASRPDAPATVDAPPAPAPAPPRGQSQPGDQDQMIRGMVERLAARLRQDGSDVEAWLRLVRSYQVLGEPEQVRTAIADARRALAGDTDKLRRLDEGLKELNADG
jgi:cytochrome c-type biogenesis protein CcmH